jgi:hypothetical protein
MHKIPRLGCGYKILRETVYRELSQVHLLASTTFFLPSRDSQLNFRAAQSLRPTSLPATLPEDALRTGPEAFL